MNGSTMNTDELIRRSAPVGRDGERGWTASPAGRAVLEDLRTLRLEPERRRLPRKRLMIAGIAAVVLGTGGAATALSVGGEPPPDWQNPNGQVACGDRLSPEANLSIFRPQPGENAFDACRRMWRETGETPPPAPYVACVYQTGGGKGGGLVVFPAEGHTTGEEACAAARMFVAPQKAIDSPAG